jgi:ribose transport system permease protein
VLKKLGRSKPFGLLVIIVFIVFVFSMIKPEYFTWGNLTTILYQCAQGGILMVGFGTLLISGNFDMSVAAVGTVGGILCSMMVNAGVNWILAVLICVAVGGLLGAFNAITWYRFRIMPFIGTLGISYVWTGLAAFITKNQSIDISNAGFFKLGGPLIFGVIPIGFVYVAVLVLIYGVILSRTKFGRSVYMSGGNMMAARISGINIQKVGTIMYINCSALCSFGGIVIASRFHQFSSATLSTTLMNSMTAVFLGGLSFGGGTGGMLGAFTGLLLLNAFNNGLIIIGMGAYWQIFAQGFLLIIALAVDYFNNVQRMKTLKIK